MIYLLDLKKFKKGLVPITTTEIWSRVGEFHPSGLFSEVIFGPEGALSRKTTFSFIDLNVFVVHPTAIGILYRLDGKNIPKILSAQETFSLDEKGFLTPDSNGVTGISEFIKMFPKINFIGKTEARDKFIKKLREEYQRGVLFINTIPVIPPDFRPIFQDEKGMWNQDKINEHYINLLRKANQIKNTPKEGALFDLLNYEVQKAVNEHDEFVRTLIKKKSGIIREQLLGKRTDFSGRAVITTNPTLKVNEIGVPLGIAVTIFEPFLIHLLLFSNRDKTKLEEEVKKFLNVDLSVETLKIVFKSIKTNNKMPESLKKIIFEAAEIVSMNRYVLAKRDPVLHPKGVRAFKPKIVEGSTIQLCTLQVKGFNADFDGDQMAIFHPLTNEAQEELSSKMMNVETGETSRAVSFELSKEMFAGIYMMMKDIKSKASPIAISKEDMDRATNPYIPVVFRKRNTTMGKAIVNNVFPSDYPFIDHPLKSKELTDMIPDIIKRYGQEKAIEIFSNLKTIAFKFATIMAPTLSLKDFDIPDSILVLKKKLSTATPEEAAALISKMRELLIEHLKDTPFYDLVESGAAKGWDQPMQILVAKGIIADAQGRILPVVQKSIAEGLTNKDFFNAAAGARRGISDRVLRTADTGYMARQLAFVLNSVEIDRYLKDCKVERYLNIRLTKDLMKRMYGRYILNKGVIEEFNEKDFKIGDPVNIRTPIYCRSKKICHTCYGKLLYRHRSPYAGVLAAQTIGEAGTQSIMRTFHTGGAIKIKQKDMLSDILQNDPLVTKVVIEKHLKQNQNFLYTLQSCLLTINMEDYPEKEDLYFNEERTEIEAKSLVARIEYNDIIFNLILDFRVKLIVENIIKQDKHSLILSYSTNANILEASLETDDVNQQIQYARRLLGGREIYKDVDHLFMKLYGIYGTLRDTDIVHYEVLLSQCLRDRAKPYLPARLGSKWDPIMMNIKHVVFNTSFIQGLAFENINEAIRTGLITDEPDEQSILEKVLSGQLVEKK